MPTPKKLTDLKFQNHVLFLTKSQVVETEARRVFKELFNSDDPVKTNKLFTEDGEIVYEAYQDSGSDDYLYLVQR